VLDGLTGAIDVELAGTRQPAHHRALEALGDLGDGVEIALGSNREAGLDDVHTHGVEEVGNLLLLLEGHGGAGALLAVAQRGVEDEHLVGVGGPVRLLRSRSRRRLARVSHGRWSLSAAGAILSLPA